MSSSQTLKTQIIIDNLPSPTPDDILNITRNILKDTITDIKILNKGGLLITPSSASHITYIANTNTYPSDIYGDKLYIHATTDNKDTTDKCINALIRWHLTRLPKNKHSHTYGTL